MEEIGITDILKAYVKKAMMGSLPEGFDYTIAGITEWVEIYIYDGDVAINDIQLNVTDGVIDITSFDKLHSTEPSELEAEPVYLGDPNLEEKLIGSIRDIINKASKLWKWK